MLATDTPIISVVLEQHAEEAAFLWALRDDAVSAPHYSLSDLAKLDDRVEAHIDGLRIAGEAGRALSEAALEEGEPGAVFAAALLAFESGDGQRIDTAVTAGCGTPESFRGLVSALGWPEDQVVAPMLSTLLRANSAEYRRLGIAACAIRRQDPGQALDDALTNTDLAARARALRAVGELGRRDLLPNMGENLQHKDDACRFWASWSALLVGDRSAVNRLQIFVATDSPYREAALRAALPVVDSATGQGWLKNLAKTPQGLRHAMVGAGITGDPVYIPTLIQQMENPELSRVAGEAFTMITGVDLAYEDLDGEWPDGFEAGPNDDPDDENVEMDVDDDLPWPDAELVGDWWDLNHGQFQVGTRYLAGRPITTENCRTVLRDGTQRQRRAAAMELALGDPDAALFETRTPGFRQTGLV